MAVGGTRSGGLPKLAIFRRDQHVVVLASRRRIGPSPSNSHFHCYARETKSRRHHASLIGAHGDAVFVERPKFPDEAVTVLAGPFAGKEFHDAHDLGKISERFRQRLSSE